MKILPVYRTSEGVENLSENYKTFDDCIALFKKNGVITIYSEGKCINEWHLRPLKKGTARLAIKAWDENIPLKVLPVGINYSSFTRFGKTIKLNFGEPILATDIIAEAADGQRNIAFNNRLKNELEKLVYEIPKTDHEGIKKTFGTKTHWLKKLILSIPAITGWLFHLPLFMPVKTFTKAKTKNTDHYDSVLISILLLTYPLYLLLVTTIIIAITGCWWFIGLLLLLPFTAWACVQWKEQKI